VSAVPLTPRDHRSAAEAAVRRRVPARCGSGARPTRRLLSGAAFALGALTVTGLTGCVADGPAPEVAAPAHGGVLAEVPTTATPGDELAPDLLARADSASSTTRALPTTAAPVTEPPTTAPPEQPTTEALPEPVEEVVEPAAPPTTAEPEPASEPEPPTTTAPAPVPWDTAAESTFVAFLNGERAGAGLPALAVDPGLRASARAQVVAMMERGGLFHQDLHDDLAQGWAIVGENVGYGPSAGVIHNALVASPGHHANIVHTQYSSVGIGVQVDATGRMWVSQVFGG
jgi:uncharacterized protein YkwD